MKRKIIKLAEKTFVVSLPSSWMTDQNLQKGDEIDLTYLDDKLLLSSLNSTSPMKQTHIDISKLTERILRWEISSLHKMGYDEIIITGYSEEQVKIIEDLINTLFVGFIIKEKTQLKLIIGQIAITDASEFDSALRRAFRQVTNMSEEIYSSFKTKNTTLLLNQINLEHENNKLTNFCQRLLNKTLKEKEHGHFWYVVAWNLEKIADNFKYIAQNYKMKIPNLTEKQLEILKKLNSFLQNYYDCFYSFSFDKLIKLSENKKELEKEILLELNTAPVDQKRLFHYLHIIILQTTDFSASMIALKQSRDKNE